MVEESVGEGKRGCYVNLSPDVDDSYWALFDMASPRQRLHPRYLWYPHTIDSAWIPQISLNTKLACHHPRISVALQLSNCENFFTGKLYQRPNHKNFVPIGRHMLSLPTTEKVTHLFLVVSSFCMRFFFIFFVNCFACKLILEVSMIRT